LKFASSVVLHASPSATKNVNSSEQCEPHEQQTRGQWPATTLDEALTDSTRAALSEEAASAREAVSDWAADNFASAISWRVLSCTGIRKSQTNNQAAILAADLDQFFAWERPVEVLDSNLLQIYHVIVHEAL